MLKILNQETFHTYNKVNILFFTSNIKILKFATVFDRGYNTSMIAFRVVCIVHRLQCVHTLRETLYYSQFAGASEFHHHSATNISNAFYCKNR